MEDVAGQTFRMHADEHVLLAVDIAVHECDVLLAGQRLLEEHGRELAVCGRQANRDLALDELLVPAAVLDQVGDGDEPESVLRAEIDQVGDARHRAVVLHHLADHAGGVETREPREIDCRLGLARALEDAAARARATETRARARRDRPAPREGSIAT